MPKNMKVKGYREEIIDEDDIFIGELWFIGELD